MYELHPLAELFPAIEGVGFEELVVSIQEIGQQEPIVLLDDKILDGRCRYNACLAAGVEPVFTPFRGDDPVRFVLAANVHRRHLSESQRAMIGAKIATMTHGGDRKSDQAANLPVPTQAQAAEMLNVSERTVRSAKHVLDHAEPEDVKAIVEGRATVGGAMKKLQAKPVVLTSRDFMGVKPVVDPPGRVSLSEFAAVRPREPDAAPKVITSASLHEAAQQAIPGKVMGVLYDLGRLDADRDIDVKQVVERMLAETGGCLQLIRRAFELVHRIESELGEDRLRVLQSAKEAPGWWEKRATR
jgi:hypothetical protein